MVTSSLDPSHGLQFAAKVRSLLGTPVVTLTPDDAETFSRSRFRLTKQSVGEVLHSLLGGSADPFAVVEVNINQQNLEDDAQVRDGNGIDLHPLQPLFDLNQPVEVEVFIPMDNGVPLQIMLDEINEDDLGDGPNEQGLGQQDALNEMAEQDELNHMQLGFVHVETPVVDPVLESIATGSFIGGALPADFYRFWSKHFSLGDSQQFTKIALEWAAFFTAALLNPARFEWAKRCLTSPAWEYFTHASAEDFSFVLPSKCPSKTSPSCLAGNGEDTSAMVEAMVDATLDKDENEETELILEEQVNGNDIGSCETPQNVSPSTGPWSKALLTKQALNKKKKPSAPRGKKVPAKKKSKEYVDNEEHQEKNAKKKARK
ncbi:hypothetical protein HU200_021390 [Digitaria exilis]|uniref:Uncharacterized protein n=1 Tax=Digitaria exilis TaxID=1010633 RepID=A0A835KA29_9POAL|nr:hypothetical protein HU200_021390 [Digitaria exilis]